jgi:hypothetical protein
MRLVLFPPESSKGQRLERNDSLMNRPRPLRRTRTAPGALSPTPSLDERTPNSTELLSPMSEETEELLSGNRQALTPTPSTPSQPSTPKDDLEVDQRQRRPTGSKPPPAWKYTLIEEEPAWEMLTVRGNRQRSDSKDSDAVRINNAPLPPIESPTEEDWHHTAEVSIARSLSVTRPRMQLLRPVKVDNERLVERKVLTPTLTTVDVRNRKSVRVQIEDA